MTRVLYLAVVFAWGVPIAMAGQASPRPSANPQVQTPSVVRQTDKAKSEAYPAAVVEAGSSLFQQKCSFCHGRDAGGGESGPDLTRSQLVADDKNGDKIGIVVRNGRVEKGMPKFTVSDTELAALAAFVHTQKTKSESAVGGRRGVDPEDLQTGNVAAGKAYFDGPGGCSGCHSASGDLAQVATRFKGLKLEQRMLYPRNSKAKVTVTPNGGQTVAGTLAYRDEWTLSVLDEAGVYRTFPISRVKYKVDDPAEAHAELLGKYTDDDIHNLMAYLQTLK